MKPILEAVLMLGLVMPAFSVAPEIDFDGATKKSLNITQELKTNAGEIVFEAQPEKNYPEGASLEVAFKSESGEWVVLTPQQTDVKADYYTSLPNAEIRFTYGCRSQNPPPNSYWSIRSEYRNFPSFGGHQHSDPPPPNIKTPAGDDLPNPIYSRILPVNTDFIYYWKAPEFATRITNEAVYSYSCTDTRVAVGDIKIPNLVEIKAGIGYVLGGNTPEHTSTHYVTSEFKAQLLAIGETWKQTCLSSALLRYNQMSLPWGGLFDVNDDWKPPHSAHRFGNNADISKKWVRKGNRAKLVKMMCGYAHVYSEGDGAKENSHYHLASRTSKHPEDFPDLLDTRYIYCCPTPMPDVPQACIDLENNGTPQPEEPTVPVETDCP